MKHIALSFILTALLFCSCGANSTKSEITAEMAYEGVSNYCHSAYDWSVAKDNRRQTESQRTCSIGRGAKEEGEANPSMMYVQMGEETDSAYQVVFRSYTGALVNFYVDKANGTTRMVEKVPSLNIEEDAGTIELFDYLEKKK
jgi:hypothetical protein